MFGDIGKIRRSRALLYSLTGLAHWFSVARFPEPVSYAMLVVARLQ